MSGVYKWFGKLIAAVHAEEIGIIIIMNVIISIILLISENNNKNK